jgi:hypothetical protein
MRGSAALYSIPSLVVVSLDAAICIVFVVVTISYILLEFNIKLEKLLEIDLYRYVPVHNRSPTGTGTGTPTMPTSRLAKTPNNGRFLF